MSELAPPSDANRPTAVFSFCAIGRDRLADADLTAGADEGDLVLAGQLVEKRGEPRAQVVEERRDGAARVDDQRDPHRAADARGAHDLAADAVLEQLEFAGGQVEDRRAAAVRGGHVDAALDALRRQRRSGAQRHRQDGEGGAFHGRQCSADGAAAATVVRTFRSA